MKNPILLLSFWLLAGSLYSQGIPFEYAGRSNPAVKKEKLNAVNSIRDIVPEIWYKLGLPFIEREELEHRRKMDEQGCFIFYPQGYNYNRLVEYVSTEISVTSNGKTSTAQSISEQLSTEQKAILKTAALGTDIVIKIGFRYKNMIVDNKAILDNEIREGGLVVSVVPETEAQYPGGFKQLTGYLTENIFNKVIEKRSSEKLQQAVVKFSINEAGEVVDTKILRMPVDQKLDRLILDAMNKMPKWNPAQDSKGKKIKQEFNIPFGGDGC